MNKLTTLTLKGKCYTKDTTDLIDYDSLDFNLNLIDIKEEGNVLRNKDKLQFSKATSDLFDPYRIFSIKIKGENYHLNTNPIKGDFNTIYKERLTAWFVNKGVKFTQEERKQFRICEGDIIRLGRVYIKVWKIQVNEKVVLGPRLRQTDSESFKNYQPSFSSHRNFNSYNGKINNNDSEIKSFDSMSYVENFAHRAVIKTIRKSYKAFPTLQSPKKKDLTCRICFSGESDTNKNPLIAPCQCSGSVKYIHYQCLKNWLKSKLSQLHQDENCITYNMKEITCELCKNPFPDYIIVNGEEFNISFYEPDDFKKYIIFETISNDKERTKKMHVVNFEKKKKITVGRAKENDFFLPEMSVSRLHMFIYNDNGRLYIDDNNSKFGSLVLLQNHDLRIVMDMKLKIQIDRTYLKFHQKKNFSIFGCCGGPAVNLRQDYQRQNLRVIDKLKGAVIINNDDDKERYEEKNEEEGLFRKKFKIASVDFSSWENTSKGKNSLLHFSTPRVKTKHKKKIKIKLPKIGVEGKTRNINAGTKNESSRRLVLPITVFSSTNI